MRDENLVKVSLVMLSAAANDERERSRDGRRRSALRFAPRSDSELMNSIDYGVRERRAPAAFKSWKEEVR